VQERAIWTEAQVIEETEAIVDEMCRAVVARTEDSIPQFNEQFVELIRRFERVAPRAKEIMEEGYYLSVIRRVACFFAPEHRICGGHILTEDAPWKQ